LRSRRSERSSTVTIESTEPVAYVTSQPDPLTVLVDLRNVAAGVLSQPVGPLPLVKAVHVEDVMSPDGASIARVRLQLDRPAAHRVYSSRNFIYVDVDRTAAAPSPASATASPAPAATAPARPAAAARNAATTLTS
jgi:hypothetical protein